MMQATKELFEEQPYLQQFTSRVREVCMPEDTLSTGRAQIVLEETAFFPEGGGQSGDQGTLYWQTKEGKTLVLPVVDTKRQDGKVYHQIELPKEDAAFDGDFLPENGPGTVPGSSRLEQILPVGAKIQGALNWQKRFDRMQQHTAEHILSEIVCRQYGYDNVGFRLSEEHVTMDYSGPLTMEQVLEVEKQANAVIWDNLPVKVYFPGEQELETLQYRSKKEITEGALRIVEIVGIDVCACCAPHVKATGEVGLIKIVRLQNWKGGVRLYMAAGGRALALMQAEHDMITTLAKQLSTSWENIPDRFDKLKEELISLKRERKQRMKEENR